VELKHLTGYSVIFCKVQYSRLYAAVPAILPLYSASVLVIFWNGLHLPSCS